MTIGSRHNLANAKFKNLELDNRPIEHKPSAKLLGVYIDEMLIWDNQIKHISSKVFNGLRMLYLARKLTDNQETFRTFYYSLVQPYFAYCDIVWGDCSKHVLTNCKSYKIEQHGLSLGMITLSDHQMY